MNKDSNSFDEWFSLLESHLQCNGIVFKDEESVRGDYDEGRDVLDVLDDILREYGVDDD